ncbi:PREDICTED: probable 3-deoxy-D-manno-octulosonic acid transferase, mitochondrial isoform X2 [Tarenaya hassleriana]|uniref:probable 3-deoxy-D-manno-octulosonic acid transferase, mitochondrial isoform X2 n=1 Tax=Tarenaya hassleriana TaxID=28532 RepID=UPI00053CA51F|nr:PREDICTED: probable 3-deoxy-D-manno-octulosonic acid transferase, mitochondrial isoform X2 [Tarenaya hassleriana]
MEIGMLVYKIYRALTYGLSPLVHLHVRWRRLRGLEHRCRWLERFGHPSAGRQFGPLVWFHAVSLGEGMAAIPVIRHCHELRPDLTILMTTTTVSAFEVIKDQLPFGVIFQFAPLDTPVAIDRFLSCWKPNAIIIMESELWPNLIMSASGYQIPLALLNARMSTKSFKRWSRPLFLRLAALLLSKFSLITPLSTTQAIHFQLLQAPPAIINFSGDLKYVVNKFHVSEGIPESIRDLEAQLLDRKVWIASSLHRGEEEVILGAHDVVTQLHPKAIVIIVPRHPHHGREVVQKLRERGQCVALRTQKERITSRTNIYVADTLGELRHLYRLAPIAVIGGSFLPGLAGHNLSEAAAAGCAIITGHHVGHFSHMVRTMQQSNPLSVVQVRTEVELGETVRELLRSPDALERHQRASKQVYEALSSCVTTKLWSLLHLHLLSKILP